MPCDPNLVSSAFYTIPIFSKLQIYLYIVQLPNEEGDMHIIQHLVHHDMLCDPNLVSSAFYTIPIFPFFYLYNAGAGQRSNTQKP